MFYRKNVLKDPPWDPGQRGHVQSVLLIQNNDCTMFLLVELHWFWQIFIVILHVTVRLTCPALNQQLLVAAKNCNIYIFNGGP